MGSSAGPAARRGLVPGYHCSHSSPATSEEPASQLTPSACAFQNCCAASGGCIDCISSTYSGSSHLHEPSQAQPPLGPFLDHMYAAVAWCNLHHNHILCRTTMRCRQYVLNLHAIKLQGHNLLGMINAGLGLQAAVSFLYVCPCSAGHNIWSSL